MESFLGAVQMERVELKKNGCPRPRKCEKRVSWFLGFVDLTDSLLENRTFL